MFCVQEDHLLSAAMLPVVWTRCVLGVGGRVVAPLLSVASLFGAASAAAQPALTPVVIFLAWYWIQVCLTSKF